jgi:hypothetical protein
MRHNDPGFKNPDSGLKPIWNLKSETANENVCLSIIMITAFCAKFCPADWRFFGGRGETAAF